MVKTLERKTPEFKAVARWLETDKPLEVIAGEYGLDPKQYQTTIAELYTRCVEAAEKYHSGPEDLTHSGAALQAGVDLWVYEYFLSKYQVPRSPGQEGLRRVEKLKENPLYNPALLYAPFS